MMPLEAHDAMTVLGAGPPSVFAAGQEGTILAEADRRIAACAHELRTPIGGMLALADLLLASDLDAAQRRHADALKQAADHLLAVTDEILAMAKLRHEEAPPVSDRFDLRALLQGIAAPLAARGFAKGVEVRLEVDPLLPEAVTGDCVRLRRIIDNLADNALRATDTGEISLRAAWADTEARPRLLRLTIEDTGPGFGPDPMLLFRPFVQGPAARGGTGLGLAIVAALAETLGGTVAAANRPSGGASVRIEIPLEPAAPAEPAMGKNPGRWVSPNRLRVLVVEDNAANRIVIGSILEEFGHSYRMVGRAAAAIEQVARGEADIVLMDAVLPGTGGAEAIRAIRALAGKGAAIPIIGLTANRSPREHAGLLEAGANAVVTKPISVRELWQVIESLAQGAGTGVPSASR